MFKLTFRNILTLLIIISLLAAILSGCGAPISPLPPLTTGIISGQAVEPIDLSTKDITGYIPMVNAEVTIVDADGVTHTVLTDENGYYSFDNLNININTVITITKETEEGIQIFKDVVPRAVSQEENYDAGIADALSTATALVVEELVNLGQVREAIDLDEIASSEGFNELKEDVRQAQEDNQDINIDNSIITQLEEIADNMVNPPTPAPTPAPSPAPSSDATLSALSLSSGTLNPAFASATTSYTAEVVNSITSINLTPTATDSNATIKVSDLTVASGSASSAVSLDVGENTITTIVTAQDGTTTKTYTVVVTRTPGDLDHFTIIGYQTSVTAGVAFTSDVVVTAYDADNNVKTDYTGEVYFTSTDGFATLPYILASKYTFIVGNNGVHTFPGTGFTLKTAGSKTITLTDGTVSVTSSGITVRAATKSKLLWVIQPASSVAVGATWDIFTIEITDAYGNRTPDTDEVTIDPSSLTVGGTTTKAAVNGLATFGDITRSTAGTITISASASGLTATPASSSIIVVPHTVTFDSQGGSTVVSQEVAHGGKATEPTSPTKTGYTFGGWYKESGCTNPWVFASDTVTSDVTLYAQWTIITYTITASADSNGAISPLGAVSVDHGANQSFTITTDTGYHIEDVKVDDSSVGAVATYEFTNVTADHTIAATFAINTYTVTFDKNDAGATGTMADQTFTSGSSANLTAYGFTKTGWSFGGWAETPTGDATYADQASYTMGTENVILYAKWTINTYTVTYNGNGNTGGTAPTDASSYEYGATVTVLTNSGNLEKTGYTFDGWNTKADGSGTPRAVSSTFTMGAANVTLYAKWVADYALRDTGPAGGLIFYVKEGGYSDGWMYLEAAPASTEWTVIYWGSSGTLIGGTGTGIGTGQSNTTIIVDWLDDPAHPETDRAAQLCDALLTELTEGSYTDWFLPSKDELNLMYTNLYLEVVGAFAKNFFYSSSEYNNSQVWGQYFGDGNKYPGNKTSYGGVRAVRAF